MTNLRIGIVCYPSFGGSGVIATELGTTLANWGHQVHFFSYAAPSRLDIGNPNICIHEVEGFSYPLFKYPPYDLALASRLIEVAEGSGLDVIHAHYAIPHAISAFLARESTGGKFKTVTTLHGTDITLVGAERSYFPITRFGIEKSDAVTSVSNHLKEETIRIFRPNKDIEVIPNFVDTKLFLPKPKWGKNREKTIVHISNFRPVKRVGDIIQTFGLISKSLPSRLLLIGDGPDLQKTVEQVRKLKLDSKVEFLGNQTAIPDLLGQADLFLLASETESFGLSVLEAMSCGVPAIVPAVGGLPEVISDGESGVLVADRTPEGYAQASLRVLQDDNLWRHLSEGARERASQKFEREKIVRLYLTLYEKILGTLL